MTTLHETIEVPLSAKAAEQGILRYLNSRRRSDGTVSVPLRVALGDVGIPSGLDIERRVEVRVHRQRDEENLNDELAVSWRPERDGAYPSFDGRIIVWSEDDPNSSFIELRGTYEPPLGDTGLLFDAALGKTIARSTARRFLEDLRDGVLAMEQTNAEARP